MNLWDKQRIFYFPSCDNIQVQLVKKKSDFLFLLKQYMVTESPLRIIFAKITALTESVERLSVSQLLRSSSVTSI